MDKGKNRNVIAIAIKPKFAHAILTGQKSVEFRRNGAPKDISHLVLYSTKPDQKILGYCEVRKCIVDTPNKLWENYGKYGFINKKDFKFYYEGYDIGRCYIINKSFEFLRPVPVFKCKSFKSAPQSFVYLEQNEWINFKRKKFIKINHSIEI